MFRPKTISQTGAGNSAPFMLDRFVNGIALVGDKTGTVTDWGVQFTMSDLQRGETAVWQDHSTLVNIATGSDAGNFNFPPIAIRLKITTGTGTIALSIAPKGVDG